MRQEYVGIYYSAKEKAVVRVTSPYWVPKGPEWLLVTRDASATLAKVREVLHKEHRVADPSLVHWGTLPAQK